MRRLEKAAGKLSLRAAVAVIVACMFLMPGRAPGTVNEQRARLPPPARCKDNEIEGVWKSHAYNKRYLEWTEFTLPLAPLGTDFQLQVWEALTTIPFGQTAGYGELAGWIERPTAARAVGAANGKNPISIIVPCHRVIGAGGALTGYAWGEERKQTLLDLEHGAALSRP